MENPLELQQRSLFLDTSVAVACERARYAGNNTSADGRQGPCWGCGLETDFIPRMKSRFVQKVRLQRWPLWLWAVIQTRRQNGGCCRCRCRQPFCSLTWDAEYGSGVNHPQVAIIVKLAGSIINLKSTQLHSSEHEIMLDYILPTKSLVSLVHNCWPVHPPSATQKCVNVELILQWGWNTGHIKDGNLNRSKQG